MKHRTSFWRRNKHWLLPLALILGAVYVTAFTELNSYIGTILAVLLQFGFMIGMQIVQFVTYFGGLMYFLSGSKMEVIQPGDIAQSMKDYWGQPALVKLSEQWVKMLRDPAGIWKIGGKPPHGILLHGLPGGGKTHLARCMAGSAGVPFCYLDASQLFSMWMGMGSIKVMRLFAVARKMAKRFGAAVVVLDELDSVGNRGRLSGQAGGVPGVGFGGMASGGVLNRLLVELDGINQADKGISRFIRRLLGLKPRKADWFILVIGLTNKPDVIDTALLRSGRFGLKLRVSPPDSAGRRAIIEGYAGHINIKGRLDLEAITADTIGKTPADIHDLFLVYAPMIAQMNGQDYVGPDDIWAGLDMLDMGLAQPISDMSKEDDYAIAAHEAGHAVVSLALLPDRRITRVTIDRRTGSVSGGESLGHVLALPKGPKYAISLEYIARMAAMAAGGKAGDLLLTGEVHSGAEADMRNVVRAIRKLAAEGHLGYKGLVATLTKGLPEAEGISAVPGGEKLFDDVVNAAEIAVGENVELLKALADELVINRALGHEDIERLIEQYGVFKHEGAIISDTGD